MFSEVTDYCSSIHVAHHVWVYPTRDSIIHTYIANLDYITLHVFSYKCCLQCMSEHH